MEEERLKAVLESLLFAAGEPVALARLAAVLEDVPRDEIRRALAGMTVMYSDGARGIMLEEVAGGYQLRTASDNAPWVRKLLAAKPPRLSRPLLETIAIIAYRQPITRPEIEQLRGVDSGGVIETLLERKLIRIAGRKEAPGRPMEYATTPEFLEVFSLKDLSSLPDLEELRDVQDMPDQIGSDGNESGTEPPADFAESDSPTYESAETSPDAPAEATQSASEPFQPSSLPALSSSDDGESGPQN